MEAFVKQLEIVRDLNDDAAHASDNRLIHGDNLGALARMSEAGEQIDCVYTDPPYNTGRKFSTHAGEDAYNDAWPSDNAFYEFLRPRFDLLHGMLARHGWMYVHIDVRIAAYLRVLLLDPLFGAKCFRNEIVRVKSNPKNFDRRAYGNTTDRILVYSKWPSGRAPDHAFWGDHRQPPTDEQLKKQFPNKEKGTGRRYATTPLHATGESNGETGRPWRGKLPPKGKHWRRAPEILDEWDATGRLHWSRDGNAREIIYADEHRGNKIQDIWQYKDRGLYHDLYPTEKNLAMLESVVLQACDEGGLVCDPFAGSSGTLVAAARNGRRFVGMDKGTVSMGVSLRRLCMETEACFELLSVEDEQLIKTNAPAVMNLLMKDQGRCQLHVHELALDEHEDMASGRVLMALAVQERPGGCPRAVAMKPTNSEQDWIVDAGVASACSKVLLVDRTGRLTLHDMPHII